MTKKNSLKALSKNKGFTLVELIVVLVILAILAAILVPTLLGYIDKARSEKDFATAQAVRVAVQAQLDELYGKGEAASTISDAANKKAALKLVTGNEDGKLDSQTIAIETIELETGAGAIGYQIKKITVKITEKDGTTSHLYEYDSSTNAWTGKKS